jgi:hypothetical protein
MKLSKQQLNEYIRLYLNDLDDYGGDQDNYVLSEQILNKFGSLLTESKRDISSMLNEVISKADSNTRGVYEDFLLYIQEIQD